jgi:hypothetical protein
MRRLRLLKGRRVVAIETMETEAESIMTLWASIQEAVSSGQLSSVMPH